MGYGDVVPKTGVGQMLGCFCAIFGVLIIGLPIPIIGSSYTSSYNRLKILEKKEALDKSQKSMIAHLQSFKLDLRLSK